MNILKSKKLILVISLITSLIITNSVSANTLQGALDETNQSISEVFCPELLANGQCKYDIGDPDVDNIFKEYYSKLLEDDALAESYTRCSSFSIPLPSNSYLHPAEQYFNDAVGSKRPKSLPIICFPDGIS